MYGYSMKITDEKYLDPKSLKRRFLKWKCQIYLSTSWRKNLMFPNPGFIAEPG
jgi:hypothetical protein